MTDLGGLFQPDRVAVVGASDRVGSPATPIWRRMVAWGVEVGAEVVAVNPGRERVGDHVCHPTLEAAIAAEGSIDLAAVLVGDPAPVVADAARLGVRFAVVFASGFAEVGDAGRCRQTELVAAAAGTPLRILGPNTNLNAFESFRTDLSGPRVALLTQSGHQGRPLFMAQELGIRLAGWLPTGNEADLEMADGIEWFADQLSVGAIAAYIEGIKSPARFCAAAEHAVARGVPIVAVKAGRSERGQVAARSHTGTLAGSDRVIDAVFRQHGITRVHDLDELMDCAVFLTRNPAPPAVEGGGAVVYSISGGTGAHAVDLLSTAGVGLASLSPSTQDELHQRIPADLSVANPVDSGGHPVGDERGRLILDALVAAPEVGVLVVPITGPFPPLSDVLARDLVAVAETTDTPIAVVWGSPLGDEAAFREVLAGSTRITTFRRVSNCATALRAWLDWHRHLARSAQTDGRHGSGRSVNEQTRTDEGHEGQNDGAQGDDGRARLDRTAGTPPPTGGAPAAPTRGAPGACDRTGHGAGAGAADGAGSGAGDDGEDGGGTEVRGSLEGADCARRLMGDSAPLDEHSSMAVVSCYGVEVAAHMAAETPAEAVAVARRLAAGGPVVMKALGPELAHKSDVGGVRLDVTGDAAVRSAFADLAGLGDGRVLVAEQLDGGVEVVVGTSTDPVFGPVVAVGAGGVLAEVLDDVALIVPPFGPADVRRALEDLRLWPVLAGARANRRSDVEALATTVLAVGTMAVDLADLIAEIDLNPVLVRPEGSGAVALDALIVPTAAASDTVNT